MTEVGAVARALEIRLSTHPGQYTVLNSESPDVRAAALAELEVQAALLDAMGLGPEAVVVLHVGGAAGGHAAAADRFLAGFEQLSDAARSRLVLENDDRVFGLGEALTVAERAGVRSCSTSITTAATTRTASRSRGARARPKVPARSPQIHSRRPLDMGERRSAGRGRAHAVCRLPPDADLIDPAAFEASASHGAWTDFDVMLEAKGKDLACYGCESSCATT